MNHPSLVNTVSLDCLVWQGQIGELTGTEAVPEVYVVDCDVSERDERVLLGLQDNLMIETRGKGGGGGDGGSFTYITCSLRL